MGKKKRTAKGARALQMDAEEMYLAEEVGDFLSSSRPQERVKAMEDIVRMGAGEQASFFGSAPLTVAHALTEGLASNAGKERAAAASALCAMALSSEDPPSGAYDGVVPAVEVQLASLLADPTEYQHGAKILQVLGVFAFVHMETKEVLVQMDLVASVIEDDTLEAEVRCGAAKCMARMCLGVPPGDLGVAVIPTHLRTVAEALLRCDQVDLRIELGTLIAVMVMQYRAFVQEDGEMSDDEDEMFLCNDLAGFVDHRELLHAVEELSSDGSRSQGRGDRSRQRKHFRVVLDALRELYEPEVQLELRQQQCDSSLHNCLLHNIYPPYSSPP
eukprot:TRINITY_DN3935_c0_g1_i1.p1 TRINITY_DN3935_c0_g1~~TRINITY_DN3935_c0_g1_i1.p1  ORF type:complete len:330 (+),score=143.59 TRINITY_DN3935_c0_g1_i1:83-1072(+)